MIKGSWQKRHGVIMDNVIRAKNAEAIEERDMMG